MRIQAGAPRGGFWCVSWAVFEVDILLLVLRKVLLFSGLGFARNPNSKDSDWKMTLEVCLGRHRRI